MECFHVFQVGAILKEAGLHSVTVQTEKDEYFQHLSGLGASFDQSYTNFQSSNFSASHFIKAI